MKRKFSSCTLTPKKAETWFALNTFVGQRKRSEIYQKELEEKILDGRFHEGRIAILHNGSKDAVLMDGQHQCLAVMSTNKSVPCRLHEWFTEEGDTQADIAKVFSQYNVDKPRMRKDVAWIYGSRIGMKDWSKRCVSLCCGALTWIEAGYRLNGRVSKDAAAELLVEYRDDCDLIYELLFRDKGTHNHVVRMPVVAAIISTQRVAKDVAKGFWTNVRDGDMLRKTEPAYKIREFLTKATMRVGGNHPKGMYVTDQKEIYVKCLHAWNAFCDGTPTNLKYYADKPIPSIKSPKEK